jgi:hypothetical protein
MANIRRENLPEAAVTSPQITSYGVEDPFADTLAVSTSSSSTHTSESAANEGVLAARPVPAVPTSDLLPVEVARRPDTDDAIVSQSLYRLSHEHHKVKGEKYGIHRKLKVYSQVLASRTGDRRAE